MMEDKDLKDVKKKLYGASDSTIHIVKSNITKIDHTIFVYDRHFLSAPEELKKCISANPFIKIYKNYTSVYFYTDIKVCHITLRVSNHNASKALTSLVSGL